jgi:hypothetical protein
MMRFLAVVIFACCAVLALAPAFAPTAASPAGPPAKAPTAKPSTEPPPGQPTISDDQDTVEAGKKWLQLLDAGKPGAAWDVASNQLRSGVTRDKFIAEMRRVRKPLGKLSSRTPVKFARAHDLPGAPSGDYAIIEYDAEYANGKHLSEQLIWAIAEGDIWRVAGYFYR